MSRKGWTSHNPMAAPMFEAMADAMLLEDSKANAGLLGALEGMAANWPEGSGPPPAWDEAIATAYTRRDLALLRRVLDNRREAGLAVCRRLGIGPGSGEGAAGEKRA